MKLTLIILALTFGATLGGAFAEEPYPLKICIVSDEKLGENGKPHVFKYEGREVQLCCKDCLEDFNKEPKKYMAKLPAEKAEKK